MAINLLAIVGQTASGKSALALEIARKVPAEIIAADSKTVYKGLDIGTAKPSQTDRQLVPHHLLDLVEPGETFNVAKFQNLARRAIVDIRDRDRLPILVGGSGLYVDSILLNYEFATSRGEQPERRRLESMTVTELQSEISRRGLPMPQNKLNRRYLVRSLERGQVEAAKADSAWDEHTLVIGLKLEAQQLEDRIRQRAQTMLEDGLLREARFVFDNCPPTSEAAKSNIYAALWPYFEGHINLEEALENFVRRDLALARKQLTWFKRRRQIRWFDDGGEAARYICQKLAC